MTLSTATLNQFPTFRNIEKGFTLDISGMDIDDKSLAALTSEDESNRSLIDRMHCEMQRIEAGEIKNPDEGRRVTHFTARAEYLESNLLRDIQAFAAEVRADTGIRNVVINGIGGSALGPQLLQLAANGPYWNEQSDEKRNGYPRIYFLDNTDSAGIKDLLDTIELEYTLVVNISKSGGTQETRNNMIALERAYSLQNLEFASRAVAITMSGSKLATYAEENEWRKVFNMSESIGGRTSVTSVVGHLPAALTGIDYVAFLRGAVYMDKLTRAAEIDHNPAYQLAISWYAAGNGKGDRNMVIVPYSDRLLLLGRYMQQLVMESLGKAKDREGNTVHQGLTVYGNKGGTDAHAYIQQLNDGPDDFFITFIETVKDDANYPVEDGLTMGDYLHAFKSGLVKALRSKQRKVIDIRFDTFNVYSLGMLVALYERAVAAYAEFININAFNQPGVEAYKKASKEVNRVNLKLQDYIKQCDANPDSSVEAENIAQDIGEEQHEHVVAGLLDRFYINNRVFSGKCVDREVGDDQLIYRIVTG